MSKYIVSVFDNETAAYAGARALGQLDDEGSIADYEQRSAKLKQAGKLAGEAFA